MVYWEDIPSDSKHISPFKRKSGPTQYLTFEPDQGGWYDTFSKNVRSLNAHNGFFLTQLSISNSWETGIIFECRWKQC